MYIPYQYTVIYWEPDVVREERVNVGVCAWETKSDTMRAFVTDDWTRAEALAGRDSDLAQRFARRVLAMSKADLLADMARERSCYATSAVLYTPPRGGIYDPVSGRDRTLDDVVASLARTFVLPRPA